ncbi:sulfotransferase family 2 domain-containing protein [Shewanella sp. 10N.286.54.B9]|uniref:sulfotransferase family 2 domain-containing protein n=1 Tax=Shewanella sp. 10N.286.54.B9 TaxID=3229719 RepID=UPI003552698A
MIICDSHRFIFIHIPRTGGTSITHICHQQNLAFVRPFFQHSHARSPAAQSVPFADYVTFSFVRNPWARIYSWYALLTKYNLDWQSEFTFEEFVCDYSRIARDYSIDKDFSFSQLDYLCDDQGVLVTKFIGRYETYQQDVHRIFLKLGIRLNTIPHLNETGPVDYRDKYTVTSKSVVDKLCAKDIEYFDYKFDS